MLNNKREQVCTIMVAVGVSYCFKQQMFDEGVYQRTGMSGMCLGITYIKPSNTEVTDVSSLNFVYSRYYRDGSTAPKELFEPEKSWKYGPPSLIEYMNTTYSLIQHNMKYNPPLVYQRKGYRGIPTQILCTCDALLLGVLIDKPVQSGFQIASLIGSNSSWTP